jgi:hypothetical protein
VRITQKSTQKHNSRDAMTTMIIGGWQRRLEVERAEAM